METWHAPDEDRKAKQSKRNEPTSSGPAPQKSATEGLSNRGMQSVVPGLQLQLKGTGGAVLDETIATAIHSKRGSGEQLDSGAGDKIGKSMGHDFSDVKVHKDAESDQLNKQVHAEAFTTGKDIFFREGKYDPVSDQGQKLLAHELTHVVQQRDAPATSELRVSDPNEASEKQAEKTAEKVTATAGSSTASSGGSAGSVGRVEGEDELATSLDRKSAKGSDEDDKEDQSYGKTPMQTQVARADEAPEKEDEEAATSVARAESEGEEKEEEAAPTLARAESEGEEKEEEAAPTLARAESEGEEKEEEAAPTLARAESEGEEKEEEAAPTLARAESEGEEKEEEAAPTLARHEADQEGVEKAAS
jgi:hypothetical protein